MSEEWLSAHFRISVAELAALEEGRARISFEMQRELCLLLNVADRYFYQRSGSPEPSLDEKPSWVRDVDRWFRDHVSPHEGLFLSVARRLTGNLDTARDLVHDAYSAVLTGDRWRSVENPRAFVRKAITNMALTGLKRQKVVPMEQYSDMEVSAYADPSPDAYQGLADRERLEVVLASVDKLTGQCRQVFIMRRFEDLPPHEIAARLGISVKTVQSHLSRGMLELQKHLENHSKRTDLKVWVATQANAHDKASVAKETKR
jgi:RNA polymerase sigma-70 factor (ECF subfamily)